jgi:hypothetical protein
MKCCHNNKGVTIAVWLYWRAASKTKGSPGLVEPGVNCVALGEEKLPLARGNMKANILVSMQLGEPRRCAQVLSSMKSISHVFMSAEGSRAGQKPQHHPDVRTILTKIIPVD